MNKRYGFLDLVSWLEYSAITFGVLVACLANMPIEPFLNVLVIGCAFLIFGISLAFPTHTWLHFGRFKNWKLHSKSEKNWSLILMLVILLISVINLYLPATLVAVTGFSWILWEIYLGVAIRLHLER